MQQENDNKDIRYQNLDFWAICEMIDEIEAKELKTLEDKWELIYLYRLQKKYVWK
jgi:hypothetical protein